MTVMTPNVMRSLAVQERETFHRIDVRLVARFPELPAEQVEAAVVGRYRDFRHGRVRDVVPILVDRRAREDPENVATATARLERTSGSRSGR